MSTKKMKILHRGFFVIEPSHFTQQNGGFPLDRILPIGFL
jgi:hypothetical protein